MGSGLRAGCRVLCLMLIAGSVAAAGGGVAHAQAGSISDVHPVDGGELAARFSATSTECTTFGYCGWFPIGVQVAANAACSSAGAIVYVGSLQDTAGTETAIERFFKHFEPVRLCLYVYSPNSDYELAAQTVYATPAPPPAPLPPPPPPVVGPMLVSPASGAHVRAAPSITFRVRSPETADLVTVEVSRSTDLDADGTLADDDVIDRSDNAFSGGTVRLGGSWTDRPGTYYWQASREACNQDGSDCHAESEVRKLEIVEPPLALRFTAKRRQRLRAPRRGSAFNNLVVGLRCNLACRLRLRGYPTYVSSGRRHALRGLGLNEVFKLKADVTSRDGFRFSKAARTRLTAVMRRYGPVRWQLELRATADDGDVRRATHFIQMTPPPLPTPPPPPPPRRPAPAPQPSRPSCDPSYPTVCIPPPPPDLDCGDIPYKNFPVVGSDPHGFDGDGDGVGCES